MKALIPIPVVWQKNGDATCLARVCARDATGTWTGISGEGNFVKVADLTSIACLVFDKSGATPTVGVAVTVTTSAIIDIPITDGKIWDQDEDGTAIGYNFLHDVPAANFPSAGHKYLVQYIFTTTGGKTWPMQFVGVSEGDGSE